MSPCASSRWASGREAGLDRAKEHHRSYRARCNRVPDVSQQKNRRDYTDQKKNTDRSEIEPWHSDLFVSLKLERLNASASLDVPGSRNAARAVALEQVCVRTWHRQLFGTECRQGCFLSEAGTCGSAAAWSQSDNAKACMTFTELLDPRNVLLHAQVADKGDLLRKLSSIAAANAPVPEAEIRQHLADREKLGSTGVGHGIALPHAEVPGLKRPIGALLRLKQKIPFEAVDGDPINLAFMLLFPDDDRKGSLNILSRAAHCLREPAFLKRLAKIDEPSEVPGMMDEASLLSGTKHPAS